MALDGHLDDSGTLTRRRVLTAGAQGALALSGLAFLAGCGGAGSAVTGGSASTAGGKPVPGGVLKLGVISAGSSETVNPGVALNYPDLARVYNLYDGLFSTGPDVKTLEPQLALSAESDKNATNWVLKLRDGVVWHDGKPFTADDVIWTINSWADPENFNNSSFAGVIDFKRVRSRGKLVVEVPLLKPLAEFPSFTTSYTSRIIQNGQTPADIAKHPIGTGPFKYVSFTPGQQSVFDKNTDYWGEGGPYVDQLVIDSSFTDENARLNALIGGQIDVLAVLPYLSAKAPNPALQVLQAKAPQLYTFPMRVDKAPFDDVRVRQAMKLLADRPALIEGAFAGFGVPANDLYGKDAKYYASSFPQREQDIEQAKSLLKSAGQENLTVTLPIADAGAGMVQAATLYAQQAKEGGVNVVLKQGPASSYFTTAGGYLTRSFSEDVTYSYPSLSYAYSVFFFKGALGDETHWADVNPKSDKLLSEAMGQTDPTKAQDLWNEVQKEQYEEGGAIVWGAADYVDAAGPDVHGVSTTAAGNLNNYKMVDAWISKS